MFTLISSSCPNHGLGCIHTPPLSWFELSKDGVFFALKGVFERLDL
jgi:hypothetical protein